MSISNSYKKKKQQQINDYLVAWLNLSRRDLPDGLLVLWKYERNLPAYTYIIFSTVCSLNFYFVYRAHIGITQ